MRQYAFRGIGKNGHLPCRSKFSVQRPNTKVLFCLFGLRVSAPLMHRFTSCEILPYMPRMVDTSSCTPEQGKAISADVSCLGASLRRLHPAASKLRLTTLALSPSSSPVQFLSWLSHTATASWVGFRPHRRAACAVNLGGTAGLGTPAETSLKATQVCAKKPVH